MNAVKIRLLLLGFSVVALAVTLGAALWIKLERPRFGTAQQRPLDRLSSYGRVPNFSLVERSGKEVTLARLRGTVWIADFIYTSCQDTCPLETAEMARLQERLKDTPSVKLVSFSVDPERDTPVVLSRYADRFGADANRWMFLTGPKKQILHLVQEGFRLSGVPAAPSGPEAREILHSTRFVLVDQHARIRGYYNSLDAQALQRLRIDIAGLLEK
jgi:protein SCO1/2